MLVRPESKKGVLREDISGLLDADALRSEATGQKVRHVISADGDRSGTGAGTSTRRCETKSAHVGAFGILMLVGAGCAIRMESSWRLSLIVE